MFFICDEDDEVTIGLGGDDGRKNDTNIYIHLNPTDARAMAAILNSIADLADNEGGKGYNS